MIEGVGENQRASFPYLDVLVGDGEVGGEHGCSDFVAVGAVADECVDQTWGVGWLEVDISRVS